MEDWIAHDGKRRPVGPNTYVHIRFRNGATYRSELALRFTWRRLGTERPSDVVAYRLASVVEPNSQMPAPVG